MMLGIDRTIHLQQLAGVQRSDDVEREPIWNHFVVSPSSTSRQVWDLVGVALLVLQLVSHLHTHTFELTFEWLPLADIYFLLDMILRLRTGYYDSDGELVMDSKLVSKNYLSSWFLLDLLLTIPYHWIYIEWQSTSALRLVQSTHGKPLQAMKTFFKEKSYRQEFFLRCRDTIEEIRRTRLAYKAVVPRTKKSLLRRTARLLTSGFRASRGLKMIQRGIRGMRTFQSFTVTMRTSKLVHRTMENLAQDDVQDEALDDTDQ